MKRFFEFIKILTLMACVAVLLPDSGSAQEKTAKLASKQQDQKVIDKTNDATHNKTADANDDGLPNGYNPDQKKSQKANARGKGKDAKFHGFVDEDGDGINDHLMDSDKEGVPNRLDGDWVRPSRGKENKFGKMGQGFEKGKTGVGSGKGASLQGQKGSGSQGGRR